MEQIQVKNLKSYRSHMEKSKAVSLEAIKESQG